MCPSEIKPVPKAKPRRRGRRWHEEYRTDKPRIGITAINDLVGFQRSTYVALNYDYRKKFKWGKMGIGIGAGIIQTSIDGAQLRAPDGNYNGGVNHNDNFLPKELACIMLMPLRKSGYVEPTIDSSASASISTFSLVKISIKRI